MTKQSWYVVALFIILLLAISYSIVLFRTQGSLFLGIVILWAILLPLLSSFPYSLNYLFSLPSPIFGTWILLMAMIEKYTNLSVYLMLLALLISFSMVFIIHGLTRGRTMVWKIPMASLSRSSIAVISIIFLVLGMMLVNPATFKLDTPNEIFYFAVVLFAYIASSMLYINSSYRMFVLSNKLGTLHLERELSIIWTEIQQKFPNGEKDVDVLQYYFYESLRCFREGDFEKSLVWGYKVIREKTVVDPTKYIDDKRANKPSFSDIRNTLEHSRRKGHIDANKIRQTVKNLSNDCLDLLEREFLFIKTVSELRPESNDDSRSVK